MLKPDASSDRYQFIARCQLGTVSCRTSPILMTTAFNPTEECTTGSRACLDTALGERSAAEQRAYASQRLAALGEMTGGIAHDFRNLLAAIESGLRLAEKSSEQPEKVRGYIAAARQGINRGVKLTSQLLAFARQQELEARAADANELLRNLELLLKYSAGPETRIVLELASDVPKCLIAPSQFDAAVLNLVVNARDAMPAARFGSAQSGG
jgi:signal transduction histidine kinase